MRSILLITGLALALMITACNKNDSSGERSRIVPIDKGWTWVYQQRKLDDLVIDSLWYEPVEGFSYDGIDTWFEVCWGANEGDNPALATVDPFGYRLYWPDFTQRNLYDHHGRKLPAEAARDTNRARSLDYYLARYPIAEGDSWEMIAGGTSDYIECVSLHSPVATELGSFLAVQYRTRIETSDGVFVQDNWYQPGTGYLKWVDVTGNNTVLMNLLEIRKPQQGRLPVAP